MPSTRDPQEPTPVTADPAAIADTAGFTLVNTTRSNIKTAPSLSLGSPVTLSFEPPALLGADVTGFVATDRATSERDESAADTAGFESINTTRSNINNHAAMNPLGKPQQLVGGGLTPSVGSLALGGNDVAGFVATDPDLRAAPADDTAGHGVINTTRSNIPSKPSQNVLGGVSPVGLGGSFTPSFESPTLVAPDVAGFVATDAPAREQPADGTADTEDTEDTAGFADPIPGLDDKLGKKPTRIAPAIGFGGGLLPAFESGAQLGSDVVGFVATDPAANARDPSVEDTAGFSDPIPGVDMKLGRNPGAPRASVQPLGLGGAFTSAVGSRAPVGQDVAGFVVTDPAASEPPVADPTAPDDTTGYGLGFGLLGGSPAASLGTAPKPGEPGGPLINRPGSPFPG